MRSRPSRATRYWRRLARREDDPTELYDSEDLGLGGAFLDAAERAFEQIQAFPESSPISLAPVRAKVLSAFPFSVIYWVTDDVIIVLAVAHHRRQPGYWRGRE